MENPESLEKISRQYCSLKRGEESVVFPTNALSEIQSLKDRIKDCTSLIKELKAAFKAELDAPHSLRTYRPEHLCDKNVISVFESTLTRTLGMKTNELYDWLIVVRVYYYEILKDIMLDGFYLNGYRYVVFTASAGQIRTKKVVFIREDLWMKHQKSLMCGLSIEDINQKGGVNVNKYLAYLALCNSATEEWTRFDITKTIVVEDFETLVHGTVDYLDEATFKVNRQDMDIPIAHTDGCGMVLPRLSKKNFMIRLPFVKGLLASFPFDQFVRESNEKDPGVNHGIVTDIYGAQHDVLAEGIEIIFTKSQTKLWKYYEDWKDYQKKFIENDCTAGVCNMEENYIPRAKLNYQVLQTLSDMTYDETEMLAESTVKKIENLASCRANKLDAFRATRENHNRNDFQNCLLIYPELLTTPYLKETLRQIKDSMIRDARAGKLDIEGRYLFIVPDLYAFCQSLFLKQENPTGLLADGEVYCRVYKDYEKLDCLRSPHLQKEHAVRRNVLDDKNGKWFRTSGIYTSCHDLITKILMNDNDGDRSLVVADPLLVKIAERNMDGVVPSYYKMGKASPVQLDNKGFYDGMIQAYKGGKIGIISNDITKIWNSNNIDYEAIQALCAKANFAIDAAKTLYEPEMPPDIDKKVRLLTNCKTPYFFLYAKGKSLSQVEGVNDSPVNRLSKIIPNARLRDKDSSTYKFNYQDLMEDKSVVETKEIVAAYNALHHQYKHSFSLTEDTAPYSHIRATASIALTQTAGSLSLACDMLVHYLFKTRKSCRQKVFWLCFADVVLDNLKHNLEGTLWCANCGRRVKRTADNQKLCDKCAGYQKIEKKIVRCIDCGIEFEVDARNMKKKRCNMCQIEYRKKWDRERKQKKNSTFVFESQSQSTH